MLRFIHSNSKFLLWIMHFHILISEKPCQYKYYSNLNYDHFLQIKFSELPLPLARQCLEGREPRSNDLVDFLLVSEFTGLLCAERRGQGRSAQGNSFLWPLVPENLAHWIHAGLLRGSGAEEMVGSGTGNFMIDSKDF